MRYKVVSPLHFDGVVYAPGTVVEIDDIQAAPLLEVKVIEPFSKPFAEKFTPSALHTSSKEA
jgi:hypothetical protein